MKKIYLLLFIFSILNVKAQTATSNTLVCFRDANNNGIKEVTENVITSSIMFYLTDSASVNTLIHYCGTPLSFTLTTAQSNYFLYSPNHFNQHSNFWKRISSNSITFQSKRYASVPINVGTTINVPIPPDFGDGYLPVSDNLVDPAVNYSYTCRPDSTDFNIYLGVIDSACMAVNNYTFNPNTSLDLNLYMNNALVDSYTISQTNPSGSQTGSASIIWYSMGIITARIKNMTYSVGINSIKYVIKNVPGYTVNSIAEHTINNNINIPCGQLSGYIYVDCNNNCIEDAQESSYTAFAPFTYTITGATNTYNLSSNAIINTGLPYGNYTLTTSGPCPINSVITIPTTNTISLSQPSTAVMWNHFTHNWPCCTSPATAAVPGGSFGIGSLVDLSVVNCSTVPNPIKLKVVLAPDLFYISPIFPTPVPSYTIAAASGDTLVWNISSTSYFQVAVGVKTTAVIGNAFTVKSIILPHIDIWPADDICNLTRLYGGPLDPNNKEPQHSNMLPNGNIVVPLSTNEMVYTINFQNLGNAPAKNIFISDTISSQFNLSSFKVMNSSYPVTSQINNTTREVIFQFTNIMLAPGSANDFTNRGYVTYKIDMNPSLPVGTILKNRAHIYFDYNSPISTNQTINTLVDPTGIHKQFKGNDVYIYPNPTSGDLFVKADHIEITKYEVYELVGKKVMAARLNSNGIGTSSLTEGVYFLDLYSEDGQKVTVKFLKAKN